MTQNEPIDIADVRSDMAHLSVNVWARWVPALVDELERVRAELVEAYAERDRLRDAARTVLDDAHWSIDCAHHQSVVDKSLLRRLREALLAAGSNPTKEPAASVPSPTHPETPQ